MSTVLISPAGGWSRLGLRELWDHRELLFFFIWRDVKVRYKQTFFGIAWALIQPVMLMAVFSLFLGRLAKLPSDQLPYPIFVYSALVPWTFFSQSLAGAALSLVTASNLLSKVYFPRLVLPLAVVGSFLLDFAIAFVVLLGMMMLYGIAPGVRALAILPLAAFAMLTSLAVGVWFAALNVRYRDFQYVVPFLTQVWLFATPVAYPSSLVPPEFRTLYGLNPMTGVVEGFRWALLGSNNAPGPLMAVSVAATLLILLGGLVYFHHAEQTFADVI